MGKQYFNLRQEILNKFDQISISGNYILSDELTKFESSFADYCGTKYAVGVANGSDALFLSLRVLGITDGDDVVM